MPDLPATEAVALLERVTAPEHAALPPARALVVVAHPDDEVIALGARLGRFRDAVFLHVTDGAPLDGADMRAHGFRTLGAYREARRSEVQRALQLAGIDISQTRELRIPDQRAAFEMPAIAASVLTLLHEIVPEVIVTHPYEGGHPDHDACAFAVRAAVRRFDAESKTALHLIEAAFYHQGPQGIETGSFLPPAGAVPAIERSLSPEESRRKQALLQCFATQRDTLQYFSTDVERFRIAPRYCFAEPPHPGALYYEQFPWGMTGARFRELASEAEAHSTPELSACT